MLEGKISKKGGEQEKTDIEYDAGAEGGWG